MLYYDASHILHLHLWWRRGLWILCRLHYGPRITVPRSLRWVSVGAVTGSSSSALLVRLFCPECEPQNIAAYEKGSN